MNLRPPLLRYALWLAIFAAVGCGRKSTSQVVGESPSRSTSPVSTAAQAPTGTPSTTSAPEAKAKQSPSSDLARLETRVRPSVIWVSVFDPKGNLLRTQSGFFISADGRFVTTERAIDGEVVGVVTSTGERTIARPSAALDSLLSRVAAGAQPNWPATASATPRTTPKPRLVYAPAPAFPPRASLPGASGTGRFRLSFDAQGNVTNIQLVQSTGNRVFDESAINTLRQWKCSPGQGWTVTVPVTFRVR